MVFWLFEAVLSIVAEKWRFSGFGLCQTIEILAEFNNNTHVFLLPSQNLALHSKNVYKMPLDTRPIAALHLAGASSSVLWVGIFSNSIVTVSNFGVLYIQNILYTLVCCIHCGIQYTLTSESAADGL